MGRWMSLNVQLFFHSKRDKHPVQLLRTESKNSHAKVLLSNFPLHLYQFSQIQTMSNLGQQTLSGLEGLIYNTI